MTLEDRTRGTENISSTSAAALDRMPHTAQGDNAAAQSLLVPEGCHRSFCPHHRLLRAIVGTQDHIETMTTIAATTTARFAINGAKKGIEAGAARIAATVAAAVAATIVAAAAAAATAASAAVALHQGAAIVVRMLRVVEGGANEM